MATAGETCPKCGSTGPHFVVFDAEDIAECERCGEHFPATDEPLAPATAESGTA